MNAFATFVSSLFYLVPRHRFFIDSLHTRARVGVN
jgi:hypothetical protein